MKQLAAILAPLLILMIAITAAGCGDEEAPTSTPEPTASPTAAPTAAPTDSPEPTVSPSPSPSPSPTSTFTGGSSQLPCRFRGSVQLDGADVADDTVVTAIVEGDEHETTTPAIYGDSTYAIKIIPPSTGYHNGASVTFKIDGHTANEMVLWQAGGNILVNLTASTTQ